jgi:membrane protease YdiL (CAAX protease family)
LGNAGQPSLPVLDGSWEKPGRNPALGSLIIVIVFGSLYFLLGNISVTAGMLARMLPGLLTGRGAASSASNLAETIRSFYADNRDWILIVTDACQWLLLFLAGLIAIRRSFSRNVWTYAGYASAPAGMILLGALGAVLILPAADLVSRLTDAAFPSLKEWESASASLYSWSSPAEAVLVFLSISLTPAVCEELLFRGLFQRGLQRRLAFPWSAIVSGTVFALYHQSPMGLPALVPVGLFLGILYWASGSIWPGMAFHAIYNALVLLLVNDVLPLPSWISSGDYLAWPTYALGIPGLILVGALLCRIGLARNGSRPADGGSKP